MIKVALSLSFFAANSRSRDFRYVHLTSLNILGNFFFFYQRPTLLTQNTNLTFSGEVFVCLWPAMMSHPKIYVFVFFPEWKQWQKMRRFLGVGFCYLHLTIFNSLAKNYIQETKSPLKFSKRNEDPGKLWSFKILLYWCISQIVNLRNLHQTKDVVSNVHNHLRYGRTILAYQIYIDLYETYNNDNENCLFNRWVLYWIMY